MFSVRLRNGPLASKRTVRASIDICDVATETRDESSGFLPTVESSDDESDSSTHGDAEMNDVGGDDQHDEMRVEASETVPLARETESPVY